MTEARPSYSNLQLVARVDEWPYVTSNLEAYKAYMQQYYYFFVDGYKEPLGYVHRSVAEAMPWPDYWKVDHDSRFLTLTTASGFDEATQLMEETLRHGAETGTIEELQKFANELFPVYAADGTHVLDFDGVGVDLFGVVNYSVHLLGWVTDKDGSRKYWVPRRSRTKMSYPGMLDNTVGGSLSSGEKPIDCIIRECEEEISIAPAYTRENIKACGTASYHMTKNDLGKPGCQLQVQCLYEMEFAEDVIPENGDGEVDEIHLMSLEEVKTSLAGGEFKLNCAMTWLSYLIRNGFLHAENEPDLVQICSRLHRKHDLFVV